MHLAQALLNTQYTAQVIACFRKELLDILSVAIPITETTSQNCFDNHVVNCIILSKVIEAHPDILKYVYSAQKLIFFLFILFSDSL